MHSLVTAMPTCREKDSTKYMYTYIHINTSLNVILSETFINCILHQLPTQQDSSWYSRLRSDVAFHIHC